MGRDETLDCLAKKTALLEKIAANTEKQRLLVAKREMRGLRRLLRERGALIDELAAVNGLLDAGAAWRQPFADEFRAVESKQRELLGACDRVLQEALAERARIAAEINNSRLMRQVKNRYIHRWQIMAWGNCLNVKG
ncbi:hypothetical protein [Anaeroselena agilis]|uniref:Uncharacterized protein n=1 Tax=Anaeroselena agilis TaxID=3063788 RepID=A0ABU3P0L5_9FIRM|nr:hypothetical protein [Selenomonadales bacterium 4137-cl]